VTLTPELELAQLRHPPQNCRPQGREICHWETAAEFRAAVAGHAIHEYVYDPISGKAFGRHTRRGFAELMGPHIGFVPN
jgi:hypothetical protein